MGSIISDSTKKIEIPIVMLGLHGVEKTTILYRLKTGETLKTGPTTQFNLEAFDYNNVRITCWDVGGESNVFWRTYAVGNKNLIFVIDSSDRAGVESAKQLLHQVMSELKDAVVLIVANKQDRAAITTNELTEALNLSKFSERQLLIQGCDATAREGLLDGMGWFTKTVSGKK